MTAQRWWVRAAARWMARFDTTKSQLQAASLAVTAFSTLSLLIRDAGHGEFVPHVGIIGVIGWVVYTYLYAEGGVHNQKQRDMVDLSDNYSSPSMALRALIDAKQTAYLGHVLQNGDGKSFEEMEEELQELSLEEWEDLRNGLEDEILEQ